LISATISPVEVLWKYRVFAVVGASRSADKEAHRVPAYLKAHGYRIIPINPHADEILGERCYPTLLDLPGELAKEVDVVHVFRPSQELPEVARQTIEMKKRYGRPHVFWAQLGLENDEAKRLLSESGIDYVMNACARAIHQSSL
jgi:predicted CoA-binding protein